MRRRDPFNEIMDLGYYFEGKTVIEYPVQRIAEAQHGSQFCITESRKLKLNPEIKNDQELIDILSSAYGSKWNKKRLLNLKSEFRHRSHIGRPKKEIIRNLNDRESHSHEPQEQPKIIPPIFKIANNLDPFSHMQWTDEYGNIHKCE